MALFTLGAADIYRPLLDNGAVKKLGPVAARGLRDAYLGGIVFPTAKDAVAWAEQNNKSYAVYELEGEWSNDVEQSTDTGLYHIKRDLLILREVAYDPI